MMELSYHKMKISIEIFLQYLVEKMNKNLNHYNNVFITYNYN